jgi:hypothetical protein
MACRASDVITAPVVCGGMAHRASSDAIISSVIVVGISIAP